MIKAAIKQKLIEIVEPEQFQDNQVDMLAYSYDASPEYQALPDAVIAPRNTLEIAEIVKICATYEIPIIPRGSGSNLSGGTTPTSGGLVLLFKNMDKIIELDKQNLTITVEPGVITSEITKLVEKENLFYPPDPGSMVISTIGGNISENSGGLRGLKYGVTRDYVMGLEVVLANGDIIETGGKFTKDVAGYDLTRLFIGAEGTLGIVTKAILKLVPKPETNRTLIATFRSISDAGKAVSEIIAAKIVPATMEFLDQITMKAVEDFSHVGLPTDAAAILLIQQDGQLTMIEQDIAKIKEICHQQKAIAIQIAQTIEEGEKLMTARRTALSALARIKPTTVLEDATVPRSKVSEMVTAIQKIADKYQLVIGTFGHAGDGNLHPTCLTDLRDNEEMLRVHKAFDEIYQKTIEFGGTVTGEHGVGLAKIKYLPWQLGKAGMRISIQLKNAFDPKHILNPGKMFSIEKGAE